MRPQPGLEAEVRTDGSRPPELRLRGEVDIVTVPLLEESLTTLAAHDGTDAVVVDLGEVDFIGVAGLSALCSHARRLHRRGQRLVVSSPSPLTRRVIGILGVAELLSLADSEPSLR